MIAERETPAGVWNYPCPTCHARGGFMCDTRGRVTEDVHAARLAAYRRDLTWSPEAEAADRFAGSPEEPDR